MRCMVGPLGAWQAEGACAMRRTHASRIEQFAQCLDEVEIAEQGCAALAQTVRHRIAAIGEQTALGRVACQVVGTQRSKHPFGLLAQECGALWVVQVRSEVEQRRRDDSRGRRIARPVAGSWRIEIPWRYRVVTEPFKIVV